MISQDEDAAIGGALYQLCGICLHWHRWQNGLKCFKGAICNIDPERSEWVLQSNPDTGDRPLLITLSRLDGIFSLQEHTTALFWGGIYVFSSFNTPSDVSLLWLVVGLSNCIQHGADLWVGLGATQIDRGPTQSDSWKKIIIMIIFNVELSFLLQCLFLNNFWI